MFGIEFCSKKSASAYVYLPPPEWSYELQKIRMFKNLIMYRNRNLGSLYGSTLPKIRNTWKKAWNESCSELNFVQESQRAHMSVFPPPQNGARGLQRLIWLKNYCLQKQQNTFNVRLNAAKNTHHMEKGLKWKLFGIVFHPKKSVSAYIYPLHWSSKDWRVRSTFYR